MLMCDRSDAFSPGLAINAQQVQARNFIVGSPGSSSAIEGSMIIKTASN
jgi:hypothetical protein